MPAVSKANSTPLAARAVPMALTPGFQVLASTFADETTCAGGFMLAKKSLMIPLFEEVEPDQPSAEVRSQGQTQERLRCAVSWGLFRVPTSGVAQTDNVLEATPLPQVPLDGKAMGSFIYRLDGSVQEAGMFNCIRGRKSSREKILDAAAELVSDIGSGRLTLDAVAEQAGLVKADFSTIFLTRNHCCRQ